MAGMEMLHGGLVCRGVGSEMEKLAWRPRRRKAGGEYVWREQGGGRDGGNIATGGTFCTMPGAEKVPDCPILCRKKYARSTVRRRKSVQHATLVSV